MTTKSLKLLNVTDEQIEAIQIFINMNEWDKEISVVVENEQHQHCDNNITASNSSQTTSNDSHIVDAVPCETSSEGNSYATDGRTRHDLLKDESQPVCDQCYLQPCVTYYKQGWLVNPKPPQAKNRVTRRRMYGKFWSVMDYRGGWQDYRYIAKKKTELELVGYLNTSTVWQTALGSVRRDIMPDCVLTYVRGLYPNPPGVPYVAHKWH